MARLNPTQPSTELILNKCSSWEFVIFVGIGVVGLLLNELVIYLGVERYSLSYELAKLASAAMVFGFNFSARKLLLFTRM